MAIGTLSSFHSVYLELSVDCSCLIKFLDFEIISILVFLAEIIDRLSYADQTNNKLNNHDRNYNPYDTLHVVEHVLIVISLDKINVEDVDDHQ